MEPWCGYVSLPQALMPHASAWQAWLHGRAPRILVSALILSSYVVIKRLIMSNVRTLFIPDITQVGHHLCVWLVVGVYCVVQVLAASVLSLFRWHSFQVSAWRNILSGHTEDPAGTHDSRYNEILQTTKAMRRYCPA
eukprot:6191654-Pleurochrysis_carterae.AAC.2